MESLKQKQDLQPEEKAHLLYIYHTRLRYFITGFIGLMCLGLGICFRGDTKPHTDENGHEIKVKNLDYLTASQMRLVGAVWLELPIVLIAWHTYRKRIAPFKKDVVNGVKETVAYQIVRKHYFEHTGQYYVSFNDPNYMHHEVDMAFYYNCSPGDYAYIYRAPLSKYVFDKSGSFTLL